MGIITLLFCALEILTSNNRKEINQHYHCTAKKKKWKGKKILK